MNDEEFQTAFELVEQLTESQILQLHELIQQQWWGGKRTLNDVGTMVEHTSLMIGLVERSSNRLIGYCRVLTDFVFRATIYDVMIDRSFQKRGLGTRLLKTLCHHPKLQRVSFLYLACEPALYEFYKRWGFKSYDGKAQWMIKVQSEE